jgi:FlaA1/EpsC-like NDP-sugar epimerase
MTLKIVLISIFLVMTAWLYNKYWINRKFYPSMHLMQGKTVLITGGDTGIGYETAKDLLRRGLIGLLYYLITI